MPERRAVRPSSPTTRAPPTGRPTPRRRRRSRPAPGHRCRGPGPAPGPGRRAPGGAAGRAGPADSRRAIVAGDGPRAAAYGPGVGARWRVMTCPSGGGCGGSSARRWTPGRARAGASRRCGPSRRPSPGRRTSMRWRAPPLGSPALNTAWSAERASAPTRVATSAPPGASANDAASARADSLRVASAPAGRRRSRAVSSTSSQPPATRATGSRLRRRRRRRRALSATMTSSGDASTSSGIETIPADAGDPPEQRVGVVLLVRVVGLGLLGVLVGRRDRSRRRGRRLHHLRVRLGGLLLVLLLRGLLRRRRRVERHPAVALERDLDPRLDVLAGDLDRTVLRAAVRPASGTKPSTTRAGSPISRTISAIAAAYCSPSPTMRSPPSSAVIRSAPCPDSDGVPETSVPVAEEALARRATPRAAR